MVNFKFTAFIRHVWGNSISSVLVDLSPSIALISSGLGTLAFLIITKWQVPAYLGSSFAFIAPDYCCECNGWSWWAMIGSFIVGLVYGIVALIIKKAGYRWIMKLLPPIVVGPVIMVIGLALSGTAVNMAMNKPTVDGGEYNLLYFSVALLPWLLRLFFPSILKDF